MEKQLEQPSYGTEAPLPEPATAQREPPKHTLFAFVARLLPIFAIYCMFFLPQGTWCPFDDAGAPAEETQPTPFTFAWSALEVRSYLDYTPCYSELGSIFQCACLELPMDYFNGTTNDTIGLAVIRKPARVPVTHPQYGGAVIINPGGPGGSGVAMTLGTGDHIQQLIDSDDGRYFDILSFDPRGVGASTPPVSCFEDPTEAFVWMLRTIGEGVFSSSDAAFGRLWSMAAALGRSCFSKEVTDVRKYVNTAYVATDMINLMERHGEWREQEASRLLADNGHGASYSKLSEELRDNLKYRPGEEKINYWGFSYGSYLGNTFAAMYPYRINRLVVDGVVDAYDYEKSLWTDNLVDTEKNQNEFYHRCAVAGYPTCAIANEHGGTTAEDVSQRLQNIVNSLYHDPLPLTAPTAQVLAYSDVKRAIFGGLYNPIMAWPIIANAALDIENRNLSGVDPYSNPSSSGGPPAIPGLSYHAMPPVAQTAIACGDGDDQTFLSKSDFAAHVEHLRELSPTIGEQWATIRLRCVHFALRPHFRFEGPWEAKTSHPILQVGNTMDPVTPGRFAKKMAKGFEGAGVLIQDSAGHCSISSPSVCTQRHIQRYFQSGELPPDDTICGVDLLPFEGVNGRGTEVTEARQRSEGIARAIQMAGGGFGPEGMGLTL